MFKFSEEEYVTVKALMADTRNQSDGFYEPHPLPPTVRLLKKQRFCTLDKFLNFINLHEYREFDVESNRKDLRQNFEKLQIEAPFGSTIRFPDDFYVHMDSKQIKLAIEQLMNALNRLNLVLVRMVNSTTDYTIKNTDYVTNVAQSCNATLRMLGNMVKTTDVKQLKENGIYCRETFEEIYGLKWFANDCN